MRARRSGAPVLLIAALAACDPGGRAGVDAAGETSQRTASRQSSAGGGEVDASPPVPDPPLELAEPQVAERLGAGRSELVAAIAAGRTGSDLATVYGRVGQLYQAYGLWRDAELCYREAARLAPDATWTYYLAVTLQMQGRLEETGPLLDRVVAEGTIGEPALLRLGQVRLELGELDSALAAFERALELAPERAAAHGGVGRALLELGRTEEALPHLLRALELEPKATRLHHLLARAYRRLGDPERAAEAMRASGEGETRLDDPWLDRVQSLAQGSAAALRRGDGAMLAGAYEAAAASYAEAVEIAPDDVSARHSLAVALVRAGRDQEGRRAFAEALERAPDNVDLLLSLAALDQRAGDARAALERLRRAVELDPEMVEARLRYAAALVDAGRLAPALGELDAVLARDPTSVAAAVERALLLDRLGRRGDAVEALEKVVASHPDAAAPRLSLANLLAASGDYAGAIAHYRKLLAQEPGDVALRLLLTTALALDDRSGEAIDGLQDGLAAAPADPDLGCALSVLLSTAPDATLRDGDRALALARKALEAGATIERAEAVALALAELGRFGEAIAWQERLLARAQEPADSPVASRLRANLERFRAGTGGAAPWQSLAAAPAGEGSPPNP